MNGITITDSKGLKTTYLRRLKIDSSNNLKTVTSHVVLTQGIWHDVDGFDMNFCLQLESLPSGVPFEDHSSPIGSPFALVNVP